MQGVSFQLQNVRRNYETPVGIFVSKFHGTSSDATAKCRTSSDQDSGTRSGTGISAIIFNHRGGCVMSHRSAAYVPRSKDAGHLVPAVICPLAGVVAPWKAAERFCCGSETCLQCENQAECRKLHDHIVGYHAPNRQPITA